MIFQNRLLNKALLAFTLLFATSLHAGEGERLLNKFLTEIKTMSADKHCV